MDDMYQILDTIACSNKLTMVLATIIKVEGSAYKKEGSTMLIIDKHTKVGMLTAGCLEEDLVHLAEQVWIEGKPCTVQYDLSDEDDLSWGQGAGCNGVITVLLEPVKEKLRKNLLKVKRCLDEKKAVTRIKRLTEGLEPLEDLYVVEDGTIFGNELFIDLAFTENYVQKNNFFDIKIGMKKDINNPPNLLFTQQMVPKPCLYVFGAGVDAIPLVSLAARIGFNVSVIDWRPALCQKEYFPDASQLISGSPEDVMKRITFTQRDLVVIMTHNFQKDKIFLSELQKKALFYIGVLGSKSRTERLLGGCKGSENLSYPIGLSIGAKGPEEIAVSIVGELVNKIRMRGNPHK